MKKILFIVSLLILTSNVLFAQIKGKVVCADGKPAQFATVSVYKDKNTSSAPVNYAVTTKEGKFSINVEVQDGWWIAVRHIGSKEYRSELKEGQTDITIHLEIDGKSNLDEVTVKSTYTGVSVHGDTIAFDTEHFKTGDEESVSDVLKKLPGMEVSDNGDVSFGGKNVDKVLVDGKDMFSSGSDGVINTLSADAINGAEILTNYKSGSLVDDYRDHDLMALNIKTNGKPRVSGKIYMAAGYKNKYKGNADILYMGDKAYLTSILSGNNVGEEVFSFMDYIRNVVGLDNMLSSNGRSLAFSSDEAALLMQPQNVYKSNNGLWSLSGTYKPSDKFKMQGSMITNMQNYNAESLSEQLYYALDIKNTHSYINENKNRFLSLNLRETYKPKSNVEISNRTHFARTKLIGDDSLSESGLTDMFAFQDTELKKTNFQEELGANVKLGEGLLSAHVIFDNTHRNYAYTLLTDNDILPVAYTLVSPDSYFLEMNRKINNITFSPDITFAYPLTGSLRLQTTLLMNYNKNKYAYDDKSEDFDEHLTWNDYSLNVMLSRNRGLLRFSAGAEVKSTHWNTSVGGLGNGNSTDIFPKARLTLHFSTTHELSVNVSRDKSPIELEYLLRNTVITGYSSTQTASVITDPFTKRDNISMDYHYFNQYYNTMVFFTAGISGNDITKAHTAQGSSIVHSTYYDNDGHTTSRYINANYNQGLGVVPADVHLSANLSSLTSETELNGIQDEINSLNYSFNLGFTTRMKQVFNFELGGYYSDSEYDYKISPASNNMSEFGGNAGLICVYKKFRGNVKYSYSHLDNDVFDRNYGNLRFRLEYRINKWRIHIQGSNILHVKNMDWVSISANQMYTSSTFYRKIPGYILGGFTYRF
ncbi:MAG: hypothetical protein J6P44_03000 [Bacteroidales bacterium]|nr:hypothetical protein [Bacteroidales bacterium]